MRNGSSGHDERGWQPAPQHPYSRSPERQVPERQVPERELPYGPEVSWPSGFPQMNFDTGEYRQLVDDYSHVDPGYGDPGYADPRYDGQGQYSPRYQEPRYPVTGQQEILREPEQPRFTEAQYEQPRAVEPPRHPEPRAVDPRLVGLNYDELRYDDSGFDEPRASEPRDEPLDDDAWYAELRRGGPAFKPQPAPGAPGRSGASARPEFPYSSGNPASGGSPRSNPPSGGGGARGPEAAYRPAPAAPREISPPRDNGPRGNSGARDIGGPQRPSAPPRAAQPQRPATPGFVSPGFAAPQRPVAAPGIAQAPPGLRPQQFTGGRGPVAAQEQGFLGAPPVGLLTPPAGSRMDSAYAGPATQAWDAIGDVPQLEALEEYWQEEQGDVEYTALLEEFDFTATAAPAAAPARQRPGMPHPAMPHPSIPRIGRRRGGSKDHRLWIGLGGVVVVAAVAIFGIVKFEFPSAGAAHTFATPAKIAGTCYTNSASIAKSANLGALGQKMAKASGGTDPVSAAYESTCGTTAATATEVLSVIMLHLPNDSPSGSIAAFEREYPNAQVVSAGSMGGQAACEQGGGSSDEAQCVWFDNDSYGTLLSATMNANALSSALLHVRPSVELQAK